MNSRRPSGLISFFSLLTVFFGLFLVLAPTVSMSGSPVDKLREGARSAAGVSGISRTTDNVQAPGVLLEQTAGRLVGLVLSFVGVLFFGLAMYGGVLWMFARGNEEQGRKSVAIITSAVSGLIVVVGSYAITNFVFEDVLKKSETTSGIIANEPPPQNNTPGNPVGSLQCTSNANCSGFRLCVEGGCVDRCAQTHGSNFSCQDITQVRCAQTYTGLCGGGDNIRCCSLVPVYSGTETGCLPRFDHVPDSLCSMLIRPESCGLNFDCIWVESTPPRRCHSLEEPPLLLCGTYMDQDMCNFNPRCIWR